MKIHTTLGGLQAGTLGGAGQRPEVADQKNAQATRSVGEQVTQSIFHRPKPMLLAASDYPELQALLVVLDKYRRRLALLVGDADRDYALALAADGSAAIDAQGIIFLGASFLASNKHNLEVVVGAIAHEVGHRPKRMRTLSLKRELSVQALQALCLHEEIRADNFAGRGLAELQLSCEPLIAYLRAVNAPPHPEYLPVDERARVIRDGHASGAARANTRQKLFPEFDRHTSARNHLADL